MFLCQYRNALGHIKNNKKFDLSILCIISDFFAIIICVLIYWINLFKLYHHRS